MEAWAAALAATEIAQTLRVSRWGYAAVNTGHVLGIALLVGAVVPLDLRLIGLWRSIPVAAVARLLVPVAVFGLGLALATGLLLLSVRAPEYAALPVVRLKLALIALAAGSALAAHAAGGAGLDRLGRRGRVVAGALSLSSWLGALVSGRLIAFLGD